MLITPIPGANHKAVHSALTDLRLAITNLQGGGQRSVPERASAYLEWVHEARRRLRNQIRPTDLERLVPSQSYDVLLSALGTITANNVRVVSGLVNQQLMERADDFDVAIADLEEHTRRFGGDDLLVVLDTNVFMHHPQKLEDLDVHAAIHRAFEPLRIVVPMVVVDELDGLKHTGNGKSRWRAAYSVAYIDRIVRTGGLIRPADLSSEETPRGTVTLDVLLDPRGHVRQSIPDDEIADRAAALQALAGRPVHLVTYDTGMTMRARNAGLKAIKLEQELGEEPK